MNEFLEPAPLESLNCFCALCTSDHGSNAGRLSNPLRLWTAQFGDFIGEDQPTRA
jgi:hypothetical protein